MEFFKWIGRSIVEIENDELYQRYFRDIAQQKGIDVVMLFNPELCIDLILTTELTVKCVHLFSGKEDDVKRFPENLPFALNFELSKEQSRKLLGQPQKSGGGGFSFLYGTVPDWDKYLFERFSLHVQFSEDNNAIDLVTIGAVEL